VTLLPADYSASQQVCPLLKLGKYKTNYCSGSAASPPNALLTATRLLDWLLGEEADVVDAVAEHGGLPGPAFLGGRCFTQGCCRFKLRQIF
jgi:hypothetical protein